MSNNIINLPQADEQRRVPKRVAPPGAHGSNILAPNHPAVIEGRTRYRQSVVEPNEHTVALKSGYNNSKVGRTVTRGRWANMPIYTLTLEERKTCPPCDHRQTCYMNNSPFAKRLVHGAALDAIVEKELFAHNSRWRNGFLLRLHIAGDFYSPEYAMLWAQRMDRYRNLHVYGYTAWQPDTKVGRIIHLLNIGLPDRWMVRFSNPKVPTMTSAVTVNTKTEAEHRQMIPCPAQTEKASCCATCTACWESSRPIAFLLHT